MSQDIPTDVLVAQATYYGASDAFADVLATPAGEEMRHLARSNVARALRNGEEPTPERFGGWYSALWRGERDRAWRRADSANRELMRSAGVAPVTAGAPAP
jgi:hypothetical protein